MIWKKDPQEIKVWHCRPQTAYFPAPSFILFHCLCALLCQLWSQILVLLDRADSCHKSDRSWVSSECQWPLRKFCKIFHSNSSFPDLLGKIWVDISVLKCRGKACPELNAQGSVLGIQASSTVRVCWNPLHLACKARKTGNASVGWFSSVKILALSSLKRKSRSTLSILEHIFYSGLTSLPAFKYFQTRFSFDLLIKIPLPKYLSF